VIRFDLEVEGIGSLEITGRHHERAKREFGCKEGYYAAFFGKKTQKWFFSYHNFNKIKEYISVLHDDKFMSAKFSEVITKYLAQQEIINNIKEGKEVTNIADQNLKLELRPYQLIGSAFLYLVERCILADEVGLGKTPEAIAAILRLKNLGELNKALIICPSGLRYQWAEAGIEKFAPEPFTHSYVVIDGAPADRHKLYKKDALFTIMSYELVPRDLEFINAEKWDAIVIDEAQRIKSRGKIEKDKKTGEKKVKGCRTTAYIKELDSKYRWALTSTPIENTIVDMFSILEFVDPMIFGSIAAFKRKYIKATPWGTQSGNR
jgi:SNF2 family DNA or RNA helicase